ncbi:hypothetical protein LTS10_002046 [Elasticomyces elasticus]|nr:hypothetical protein LTS10_002046 [Elasticomyces elasticus]
MSRLSMSSSSVNEMHPGYGGPSDHPSHSRTGSKSPFSGFMRKRSSDHLMSSMPLQQQEYETLPLATSHLETPNTILHSSEHAYPAVSHARVHDTSRTGSLRHITSSVSSRITSSFTSQRVYNPQQTDLRKHHDDAQTMDSKRLSFFERHYTAPLDKGFIKRGRRFNWLSRGAIITAAVMLFVLAGVLGGAIGGALAQKSQHAPSSSTPAGSPGNPPSPTSPVRAALIDNFPDPDLAFHDGVYYAFATNNAAGVLDRAENLSTYDYGVSNVQIATSLNFLNWTLLNSTHDPLNEVGAWVTPGLTEKAPQIPKANVWAPSVIQRASDNKWIMYYAATKWNASVPVTENGHHHPPPHCIGAAVSRGTSPAGPYDPVKGSIACRIDDGGVIDAAAFRDKDDSLYVAYKVDGNNVGHGGSCGNTKAPIVATPIMLQKMQADGVTKAGDAVQILDRIKDDGPLVEAPALLRSAEGIYFLFFSSGCTRSPSYDLKYATSKSVTGPYVRAGKPLLETGNWGLLAPGSASVLADGKGGWKMAFHARVAVPDGKVRAMFTTGLKLSGHIASLRDDGGAP